MNASTAVGPRKPTAEDPSSDRRTADIAVPFLLPDFAQPSAPAQSADTCEKSDGSLQNGKGEESGKNASVDVVQTLTVYSPNLKSQAQPDTVDLTGVTANTNVIGPAKAASMAEPFVHMPGSGNVIDAAKSGTFQFPGNNNAIFGELRGKLIDTADGQITPIRFQTLKVDIGPMVPASDPKVLSQPDTAKGTAAVVDALNDVADDAYPVNGNNLVVQLKQAGLGANEHDLDLSKMNEPIKTDIQDNVAVSFVDNLIAAASKKSSNTIVETQTSNLSKSVFEQVEPRILGLAGLTQNGADKRILKMRLNPAELGGVEITLEKNSSGSISAHFQTESEKTRQILGESLVQLRISLENSGWQVGDLNISCNPSLSHGGEAHGGRSQSFGKAEQRAVPTISSDGVSTKEGDKEDRLVNLRA